MTQRIQGLPGTRDSLFAVGAKLLQRHAEALLAGLAKVVPVAGVEMAENIGDDEARNAWYLHDVGPAVEKARRAPPGGSSEEGRPVEISIFQVVRDRPRVG